jgi:hypothetical protein
MDFIDNSQNFVICFKNLKFYFFPPNRTRDDT